MFAQGRYSLALFAGLCFTIFVCDLSLCAKDKSGTQLLWSFDLRGVGYGTGAPNPEYLALVHRSSGVLFVDQSKVLAYFVDVNPTHQLQARGESNRFQLHLLLVDAENSHVLASESVPTSLGLSQVFAASNGQILVLAANVLRSYSGSLQLLSQEALPAFDGGETWIAAVSPAGKTLLLIHPHPGDNVVDIFARRADDLGTIRNWRQRGGFRLSCMDDYVYERGSDQLEAAALVRIDSNEWTIVHPKLSKPGSWTVSAIRGEGLIFVSSQGLFIGDISGNIQPLGRLPSGFTPATATASSRNGFFVAAPLVRYEARPFAMGPKVVEFRIEVYDVGQRELSTEMNVKPLAASSTLRVGLSPQGDKLAVMNSYMLSVHAVSEAARQ
jgi:hypothetical protein